MLECGSYSEPELSCTVGWICVVPHPSSTFRYHHVFDKQLLRLLPLLWLCSLTLALPALSQHLSALLLLVQRLWVQASTLETWGHNSRWTLQ